MKKEKAGTGNSAMIFVAVALMVLGALAVAYFGAMSALSLGAGTRYQGYRNAYQANASAQSNASGPGAMPHFAAGNFTAQRRPAFGAYAYGYVYGIFSGVLMALLGAVTLKYAKLRMKVVG
jgi:hypothetical protein